MMTTFKLGDLTVHRIIEAEEPYYDPFTFFPKLTKELFEENRHWLEPKAIDPATGQIVLCIQSYVVRTPKHTILIDSCVGDHKDRPDKPHWHMKSTGQYMRSLAQAGLKVEDIDFVMCSHLHVDHVGWNTRLENGRWVPTFPNARYIFSKKEFDYWTDRHAKDPIHYVADSILPVFEANMVDLVRSDHTLDDHVHLEPTPGHSIDHFAVHVEDMGRHAVMTGDLLHSPLQARYPELIMRADYDPEQGGRTRRKFLETHCDTDTLVCTIHFPSPSVGRISRWDDGFRFIPVSD